jgi:gliding motility-associated-like protein
MLSKEFKTMTGNMKMPAKLISMFVCVVLTLSLHAQMTTFRFSYDFGSFDITGGMVQTPAREFVVAGLNNSFGPYYGDAMKIDSAGNVIWAKAYTSGFATNFSDIKNVSTGGYIIAGSSTSGGGGAVLVRIDAAGAVLWAFKYQLPDKPGKASSESANAIIETSDGGFLVGGGVDYFWDGVSAATVDTTMPMGFKVNSSGVLQWSKVWTITVANPDEHYINDVAESADGYFFVGQSSEGAGTLSSNGDYPSNSLIIKTTTAGALTYIRRWGAGNTSSQSINSAKTLSTGNILLGGTDDVNGFIVSISGIGSVTPTVIFNRRLNGSAFGNTYLLQNVMENSDGNYSIIGTQLAFLSVAFNTMIGKINSTTGAWMFGRTYAPIGLSAILPEGGLCSDQGYYVSMTDQQAGGFNFNIIRTNTVGQTNDPASGCPGTAITPALGAETVTFSTPVSANFNLMTSSSFSPAITNVTPTRITHCLNTPAGLNVSSASSTNVSCNGSCNGTASVTASGGTSPYTYTWSPSGGNAATASSLCPSTYTCTVKDNVGATTTHTFSITQPASALASTPSQGTILCNGGSTTATVSASGGTSGYTYTWTPSGGNAATASGLTAGNYTATIKDANNCITTNTFVIGQPTAITATVSSTAAACGGSNGSATVTPSGGTGAYTYTWSPSGGNAAIASGLAAGNYSIAVTDANNCSKTTTLTVSSAGGPTVTAVQTASVTCSGLTNGTASVSISGGTPTYTVNWSNSTSGMSTGGLGVGTYTATVTDVNGCISSATVTINEPTPISITFTNNVPSACVGNTGSVTANASGGTGALTYTWNTGASGQTLSNVPAGNYTVTATDANNCFNSASVTISTVNGPTVTPVVTANVACNGGTTGAASVTISGGTPGYTVNWSGGASGAAVSGLGAGVYTITVTDAASCVKTDSVTITQPPSITVTVNSSPAGCTNAVGTATANATGGTGAMTYTWSNSVSGANDTAMSAGIYTVTAIDANSCAQTKTVSIGVTTPPTVTVTSSPAGCTKAVGTATAIASGGTGAMTYTWSNSVSGANDTAMSAGIYTVTVIDANGCTATQTVSVGVTTPPTVTVTSSPTGCANSVGTATAIASGGTGAMTYTWSNSVSGANDTAMSAGVFTVTAIDANGCSATQTVSIGVTTPPTVTVTSSPTGCTNSVGTATANATGGTGAMTYTWSNSVSGATDTAMSAGIYTVTATDANGCTATQTVSIGTTTAPTLTLASSPTGCTNSVGTATASTTGGTGAITYTWNGIAGTAIETGLSASVYTVIATDANGCNATQTVSVGSTSPPTLIVTGNATGCTNSVGTATVQSNGGTGAVTFSWSNSQTGATATGLGNSTYTVTATDANGCVQTATINVGVTASPTVALDSVKNVKCNGQANGAGYLSSTGGTPGYTYAWSNTSTGAFQTNLGLGSYTVIVTDANGCKDTTSFAVTEPAVLTHTISAVQPENCNLSNGAATITESGGTTNYSYQWNSGQTTSTVTNFPQGTYSVVVTDANGCKDSTSVPIGNIPGPTATAAQTTSVSCNGGSTGSATVTANGGTPNYIFNWSNGTSGATDANLAAGTYTVTTTDAAGCTFTTTATITGPNAISIIPSSTTVSCSGGNNGTANAAVSGGTSPYTTSWSNAQTGTAATGLIAGVYTVSVIDANLCPASNTVTVFENPPVDTLLITGSICLNDPNVELVAPPLSQPSTHQWSSVGVIIPGATAYTYTGNSSSYSNYSVEWFYSGCRYVTSNVSVTVSQDFGDLPTSNVFTPNGDNINDEYTPFSTLTVLATPVAINNQLNNVIENYELSIYDRWGLLLFKTTAVTETWNGKTTSGKECSEGTYYWIAKYKAKCSKNTALQNLKGFVQLIR